MVTAHKKFCPVEGLTNDRKGAAGKYHLYDFGKEKAMDIDNLDKQQIFTLMRRMISLTNYYALNLEELLEESAESSEKLRRIALESNQTFGRQEARGLIKMGLIKGKGLDAVGKALALSHWAVLEDLRINRVDPETLCFGVVNCSYMDYMKKRNREFACEKYGLIIRKSFIHEIEPRAVIYPKSFTGENNGVAYSCMWKITCKSSW